jgi:hypothetical protein
VGTAANEADVTQVNKLLHGEESAVSADAGYAGVEKRTEHAGRKVIWQIATRCGCLLSEAWEQSSLHKQLTKSIESAASLIVDNILAFLLVGILENLQNAELFQSLLGYSCKEVLYDVLLLRYRLLA